MLTLQSDPTLKDIQKYVGELEKERGFTEQSSLQKSLLLGEEVGELFKAIRKHESGLRMDANSKVGDIQDELADIVIYLSAIANRYNIDLETAFREKEEKNKTRIWK